MNAPQQLDCVQCKAARAVVFVFFAELGDAAIALPWCTGCMTNELPILLHAGFAINLQSADKPPALQHCEYGQDCPRLCKVGFRACSDHLVELREVYAGKSSGASVDDNQQGAQLFTLPTSYRPADVSRGGYDR